jgi:NAD(P)-dependent dehydrogenase (short-subunit alcohol dehydrogenase family)
LGRIPGRMPSQLSRSTGAAVSFVAADVRNEDDVRAMNRSCRSAFGRLDTFVTNAGGYEVPVFPDAPVANGTSTLDPNLRSTMLAMQHAVPGDERAGRSDRQHRFLGGPGLAPQPGPEHAAAKTALMRLTACLAPLAETVRRR